MAPNPIKAISPAEDSPSPIDEIVREGARRMLEAASRADVAAYVD
ncbi:hypothetical protein ACRS6B_27435 [Nocardia asteroides]